MGYETLIPEILGALGIFFLFWGIDDLFIDAILFKKKLVPKKIKEDDLIHFEKTREKKIAIVVPAWKESDVIYPKEVINLIIT